MFEIVESFNSTCMTKAGDYTCNSAKSLVVYHTDLVHCAGLLSSCLQKDLYLFQRKKVGVKENQSFLC